MKFLVFGSINIDETYSVDHIVRPGETLQSEKFSRNAGGKGANQAAALAASGCETYLAGMIGHDGTWVLDEIKKFGVNVDSVCIKKDYATGKATIMVSNKGENSILLYAGSNHLVNREYVEKILAQFDKGDWVVVQNEINCTPYVIQRAHELGLKVLFNPSPYENVIRQNYHIEAVDVLIVNEIEACALCDYPSDFIFRISDHAEIEKIISQLRKMCPNACIVITLGANGSISFFGKNIFLQSQDKIFKQEACKVKVVDTTAAGDTFLGFFLSTYAQGNNVKQSLAIASKAASLAVSKSGSIKSIPTMTDITQDRRL